jgi:HEAT repeat protein
LIGALSDSEPKFRAGAANALGVLGPAAKAAVPALKKALKDEDEKVRQSAAVALKAIGE